MARKTMDCVVAALDDLEHQCSEAFGRISKTITVGDGSEFSDAVGICPICAGPRRNAAKIFQPELADLIFLLF